MRMIKIDEFLIFGRSSKIPLQSDEDVPRAVGIDPIRGVTVDTDGVGPPLRPVDSIFLRTVAIGHIIGNLPAGTAQLVGIHHAFAVRLVHPQIEIGVVRGPGEGDPSVDVGRSDAGQAPIVHRPSQ